MRAAALFLAAHLVGGIQAHIESINAIRAEGPAIRKTVITKYEAWNRLHPRRAAVRGSKAKKLRRMVYGTDLSPRARKYFINSSTHVVIADDRRRQYRQSKRVLG